MLVFWKAALIQRIQRVRKSSRACDRRTDIVNSDSSPEILRSHHRDIHAPIRHNWPLSAELYDRYYTATQSFVTAQ